MWRHVEASSAEVWLFPLQLTPYTDVEILIRSCLRYPGAYGSRWHARGDRSKHTASCIHRDLSHKSFLWHGTSLFLWMTSWQQRPEEEQSIPKRVMRRQRYSSCRPNPSRPFHVVLRLYPDRVFPMFHVRWFLRGEYHDDVESELAAAQSVMYLVRNGFVYLNGAKKSVQFF